jgi:hypothetical protein
VFDPVVEMLENDEFVELIRLSRTSRSTRSAVGNLSYKAWTSAISFLVEQFRISKVKDEA